MENWKRESGPPAPGGSGGGGGARQSEGGLLSVELSWLSSEASLAGPE